MYDRNKKGGDNIEIKLIGSNCSNGMKLKRELKRALEKEEVDVRLTELKNEKEKRKYNIQNTPALIMNDAIVSQGKVLSEREISKLITQNLYSNAA